MEISIYAIFEQYVYKDYKPRFIQSRDGHIRSTALITE